MNLAKKDGQKDGEIKTGGSVRESVTTIDKSKPDQKKRTGS